MAKQLKFSITNVQCESETLESFKDEISVFGYGIDSSGERYLIRPVNLGSYSNGDNRSFAANPIVLLDTQVSEAVNICALCLFLVETDNGDVVSFANTSLELFSRYWNEARQNLDPSMSTQERNLFAFAQSMVPIAFHVGNVDTVGNSDEKFIPEFRTIMATSGLSLPGAEQSILIPFSGPGYYSVKLSYVLERKPVTR